MVRKLFFTASLAIATSAFVGGGAFAEGEAQTSSEKEMDQEIQYVEALINNGYPDFADPVIEATKKRWPESAVKFFALEVRQLLSLGKFDEAEAKVAALPDRKSAKYWGARIEIANNYFARNKKKECQAIYDEFFKANQSPTKELKEFYMQACYCYGQILVGDKRFEEAVDVYAGLLKQIDRKKGEEELDTWCNVASETADMYLRIAADKPVGAQRDKFLNPGKKLVDDLLWMQDRPLYFGRAIAMKALVELLKGDIGRAQATIDDYMPQLAELHKTIVEADPDGRLGFLRYSPMPQCRYMLAEMLWKQAQSDFKAPKRNDEEIKALLFGAKVGGKRNGAGAFNHAINVFVKYPESSWAAKAGELSEEIKEFAAKNYKANVQTSITPEQMARVRAMQFKTAREKFDNGEYEAAIADFFDAISRFPEGQEGISAIESVIKAYVSLIRENPDSPKKEDWRLDCDAIEGYVAERFAGNRDRAIMTAGAEAALRAAALEKEIGERARADRLYREYLVNYRRHVTAPVVAQGLIAEAMKDERWRDAKSLCELMGRYYTNSTPYAATRSMLSTCCGKLGDEEGQIAAMKDYVALEKTAFFREQARMALAQMYQKSGFDLVNSAETNATPEAVEAQLKAGSAKIIRGIKQFQDFTKLADEMLKRKDINKTERARYATMREQSIFLVGDCWRRLTKPEAKVETFRKKAAENYEAYLKEYPEGMYSTNAYVRLGTIYTALGDTMAAKSALDRLAKAFPNSPEAKNSKPQLAKSLIEMGMKREGTDIYAEMLKTTDGAYSARQFLSAGEALIEAKSWDLANQAFEKAVALAGTNQISTVAKARIGQATSLFKQKSYAEAREALDLFLADDKMSKRAIAAEAYELLATVAAEQGRTEKNDALRAKHFGAAVGAVKKLRNYRKDKPLWEQDQVDLMSADVVISRMVAEESMDLKEAALDSCARAATMLQAFIQSRGVTPEHPADKMEPGDLANLEQAYEKIVPLFAKMGAEQADRVLEFGQQYLDLFPNGAQAQAVRNCMNGARASGAVVPAEGEVKKVEAEGQGQEEKAEEATEDSAAESQETISDEGESENE